MNARLYKIIIHPRNQDSTIYELNLNWNKMGKHWFTTFHLPLSLSYKFLLTKKNYT